MMFLKLLINIGIISFASCYPREGAGYSLPDLVNFEDKFEILYQEESIERNPIEARYRLPTTTVPSHYWIWIKTDVHEGNLHFDGKVDLHFTVENTTSIVYVHNRGLTLVKAELYTLSGNGTELEKVFLGNLNYTHDREREFTIFSSEEVMDPEEPYILCIEYFGKLRSDEDGFYVSSYVKDDGVQKYLAVTQFQAVSARYALPCFDEPALKVTVDLEIVHHSSYSAISNMPVTEEEIYEEDDKDGFVVTKFDRTPVMSIYLLAFMISDFEYSEGDYQRVYARPNAVNQTEFGLSVGLQTMQAMNNYIGLPYQRHMSKMDQAAIPDFAAGAMENWGLCKYRESLMLFDPAVNTYRTRTSIATVIAHEFIHQWFGNVVTAEWWSYLWLNEGFATFYEYYAADLAYPRMEYFELFTLEQVQWALDADSRANTRPMSYSRGATANQINTLFDNIAYSKAGAVVNMFRGVMGKNAWLNMTQTYLLENELQPVNPTNLIDAMEQAVEGLDILPEGVSMSDFVNSWTEQAGYPVLEVRRNYRQNEIILSQDRFFNDRVVNNDPTTWIVPYNVVNQSFADFNDLTWDWLTARAVRLPTNVQDDRWIIVNMQQAGFYRVNYDVQNWYLIIDSLIANWASVHRLNRAQLIDDAFHLARSNRLDLEVFLDLMVYLQGEMEYAPWTAVSPILSYFNNRLRGTEHYANFQQFVHGLINRVYGTLSIDTVGNNESNLHKFLKQTISTWACRIEVEDCLNRTRNLLQETAELGELVHPDISAVTYCFGLRNSTEEAFVFVYDMLKTSDNHAQRMLLIDSLGCSGNPEKLHDFLGTAIGGDIQINYTPAERRRVLNSVAAGSRDGVDALIEFLVEFHEYVIEIMGRGTLNNAVINIASKTNNEEESERLEHLLESLGSEIPRNVADQARDTVQRNLMWPSTREGLIVAAFLENRN